MSAKDFIKKKNLEWEKELLRHGSLKFKDVGRKGSHYFVRKAWTFMKQCNVEEKVFVIERLERVAIEGKTVHRKVKTGDIEYRFGYYIVGKIGNKNGRWTWGQYCPLIPMRDLNKLLTKAKREKTIL